MECSQWYKHLSDRQSITGNYFSNKIISNTCMTVNKNVKCIIKLKKLILSRHLDYQCMQIRSRALKTLATIALIGPESKLPVASCLYLFPCLNPLKVQARCPGHTPHPCGLFV